MKPICHYCGESKKVQRILGNDNELKVGYVSKEPRKYIDACKECIKRQGGIVKIAKSI